MAWLATLAVALEAVSAFIALTLFFYTYSKLPTDDPSRPYLLAAALLYLLALLLMLAAIGFAYLGKNRTVVFWLGIASLLCTVVALVVAIYAYAAIRDTEAETKALGLTDAINTDNTWLAAIIVGALTFLFGLVTVFVARNSKDTPDDTTASMDGNDPNLPLLQTPAATYPDNAAIPPLQPFNDISPAAEAQDVQASVRRALSPVARYTESVLNQMQPS